MRTVSNISGQAKKSRETGFSLLELAIFMGIVGLVGATALQTYQTYTNGKAYQITSGRMAEVDSALTQYLSKNGRLPCPADPSTPPSSTTAGEELSTCATDPTEGPTYSCTAGGYCRSQGARDANTNGTPDLVLSGAVPYVTLGLDMKSSLDGWERKIKYVVAAKLTQFASYDEDHGAVDVIYPNGSNALLINGGAASGTGHIVLLSHGEDGKGGYTLNGGLHAACPASLADGRDFENCNEPTNAKYYNHEGRSFVPGTDHYDDIVHKNYKIVANTDRWLSSTITMQNGGGRRVGIGTSTPTNQLHVAGNIKAGEIVGANLCNYGGPGSVNDDEGLEGANCLPYNLFGGTGSSCAASSMTGIQNAVATCALTIAPGSIPAFTCIASEVACGIRADKSLRCRVPGAAVCPP